MKLYLRPGWARLACPRATDEPGHRADVHFVWQGGSEHADHHQAELSCECGRALVYVAGADPWKQPALEIEGKAHDQVPTE